MAEKSKFRKDSDLGFLQDADWQDLKVLASILINDFDGKQRRSQNLQSKLQRNKDEYGYTEPDLYEKSWKDIAGELQLFGGDTIVNTTRRKGVLYKEIVKDVAKKINANKESSANNTVEDIEKNILMEVFGEIPNKIDLDLLEAKLKEKGYLGLWAIKGDPIKFIKHNINKERILSGVSGVNGAIGLGKVVKYTKYVKYTKHVKSMAFAGRAFASTATVSPLGIAFGTALLAKDITSPAYRVTIPAVCIIAIMRIKHKPKNEF
ncbi:DUF3944 domain-containing protein [Psychrobacter sp. I-STPA6b]|uniref:DUF3944 domain-containing protein n=1 Tax=Psychrobacter sp. I-STPA6b TaxID=2585718 RepID=UPI001D0C7BEB|nr:DUF3944 domain-containing protein [Psychrobacter sp. I-STPA6b]